MVRCWEGLEDKTDEVCLLEAGHGGDHEFTPKREVTFNLVFNKFWDRE